MLKDQLSADEWLVTESGFDPERANFHETVFTVGNGRLGTRGSLEEGHRGELSGTFLSGVYDAHDSPVIDLVNAPDWLAFAVRVDGVRLDVQSCAVVEHERALDLRQGLLHRRTVLEDGEGRRTRIETLRFASSRHRNLCALRVEITPENHDAPITVESALDGHRRNLDRLPVYPDGTTFPLEVRWEKWAHSKHLDEVVKAHDDGATYLEMRTIDSGVALGYAAGLESSAEPVRRTVRQGYERIEEVLDFEIAAGETLRVEKLVTIATSRDQGEGSEEPVRSRCLEALAQRRREGFDRCLEASVAVWDEMWADCDCEIVGDAEATKAVRFGIYHLLIAANGDDPTVNIGAKSLSGEGYRGHVFWDTEVMMLPFFVYTQPGTARSLLRYRHHTMPGAREVAREGGLHGARFPWESADTGREECPRWSPDGVHRLWMRDEEVHVSADVAYGVLTYVQATGDTDFLLEYGAELLFETSRFWVDRVEYDAESDRYSLKQVMGPDEFHSHVDDNAFTNRMAQWHLRQSAGVHDELAAEHPDALAELDSRLGLEAEEVEQWRAVAERIVDPFDQERGLIEQFAGYFERKDVPVTDWDANDMPRYPDGYHHFNCEDTMLLKQPDVVMLTYMLPDEFTTDVKRANFDFYEARTLHKSSLSPAIHAIMGIEVGDATRAVQYFFRSALVDLTDNQGNTAEGMHIASAGGTWQALVCGFGGFRVREGTLTFDPWLPERWQEIRFRLQWHGDAVDVAIGHTEATLCLRAAELATEEILVRGEKVVLTADTPVTVPLAGRSPS
jgi:kojibiose phosphorylase